MTTTIMTGATARPYRLINLNRSQQELRTEEFDSLEDLACAAYRAHRSLKENTHRWFLPSASAVYQKALTPRGKPLAIQELVAWGARITWTRYSRQYRAGYVWREGSVPDLRKWRGGSNTRPYRVQGERRLNALVIIEDGEVPARVTRRGYGLPDSRDGRPRTRQRSWKSQHKGCKNWDRPARHGKAKDC